MTPKFPEIPLESLKVRAKLDFFKVFCEVNAAAVLSHADPKRYLWNHDSSNDTWTLTVHDPCRADLIYVDAELERPELCGLEIAVDFTVRASIPDPERAEHLQRSFRALAARYRPEDELTFGGGYKAAHAGKVGKPFHGRLPNPGESLVYGHRSDGHNCKLYLKTTDQAGRIDLPPDQHSVRLETTLTRYGLFANELTHVKQLLAGDLRARFAKCFRIIEQPQVRVDTSRSPEGHAKLEAAMISAWDRAGVNAFDLGPLDPDASAWAKDAVEYRKAKVLPLRDYKLRRHSRANDAIGNALRQLDRRLHR